MQVVERVLSGSLSAGKAETLLREHLRDAVRRDHADHALKIRTAIRLVVRYRQFQGGTASTLDLLASIRDFIGFVGRFKPGASIGQIVRASDAEAMGLYIDSGTYVNVNHTLPEWFAATDFLASVYSLERAMPKRPSLGDGLLAQATGFESYRSFEQKIGINSGLALAEGSTMLLALPTGGGKSLLTQMLASYSPGLTLVIVPTVALALDQYRAAQEVVGEYVGRESIACYHASVRKSEGDRLTKDLADGSIRLLFTSPEAVMRNSGIRQALINAAMQGRLANLVVDEAHIVIEWGALFRPDFQFLAVFRRRLLAETPCPIRTYLLSATLSDETVDTLRGLFSEGDGWLELRFDALRPEPRFSLLRCRRESEKRARVMELCKRLPRPMILYVLTPDDAEQWEVELRAEGFRNVAVFTGETDDERREEIITGWNNETFDFVVANSAFGMGVDKPDVRTIIHACMPESLNRFYQEVGRGGRDGLASLSVLCVNTAPEGDKAAAFSLVNKRVMSVDKLQGRWRSMLSSNTAHYDGDTVVVDTSVAPDYMEEDRRDMAGKKNVGWNLNALLFLCRRGYVELEDCQYEAVRQSYRVTLRLRYSADRIGTVAFRMQLEEDRGDELDTVLSGFRAIEALVFGQWDDCWGEAFSELYCLAECLCGGCPVHQDARVPLMTSKLQRHVAEAPLQPQAREQLLGLMGECAEIWINRSVPYELDWHEMSRLASEVGRRGIPVWVVPPDLPQQCTVTFPGLVLTPPEFFQLARQFPLLLARGLFCCMADHDLLNQRLFEQAWTLKHRYRAPIVFYGDDSMEIISEGRTIRNLVEGYIRRSDYFLRGRDGVR